MKNYWFKLRSDIFELNLSNYEILVYIYLAKLCSTKGEFTVSNDTIAKRIKASRATVKRATKKLEEEGFIQKIRPKYGANTFRVNQNLRTAQIPKGAHANEYERKQRTDREWKQTIDSKITELKSKINNGHASGVDASQEDITELKRKLQLWQTDPEAALEEEREALRKKLQKQ